MAIFYNAYYMTLILEELKRDGYEITPEILAELSPYWMSHINRYGLFSLENLPLGATPDFTFDPFKNFELVV